MRTVATQTIFTRGGDQRPHRGALGHRLTIGLVATHAAFGKRGNALYVLNMLAGSKSPLFPRSRQMVVAHVVTAALEQCGFNRQLQRIAHARQIAVKQLILQRFGTGGDDDFATGEQRRHQVGKRFSGASARLRDQLRVVGDGLGNGAGKLHLLRARAEIGLGEAKRSVGAEDAVEVGIHLLILLGRARTPVRLKSWFNSTNEHTCAEIAFHEYA